VEPGLVAKMRSDEGSDVNFVGAQNYGHKGLMI